jgi:GNAT superfamily N-acetyltransferase
MLEKLEGNDRVLSQNLFMADEVQYNLVHRIYESVNSTCLTTSDGKMIYAQSQGHNNAWLWIAKETTEETRQYFIQELIHFLKDTSLPGISADPHTADLFAQLYSEARGIQHHSHMIMESYYCPEVKKPWNVEGTIQQAAEQHVETVAKYIAGFSEEAHGLTVEPESQISAAEALITTGNLYFWMVDNHPVTMANIAHRSPRHARINAVYTPPGSRKKGYASALVSELCSILESERLRPMLYADLKNPDSNKVYKNIGFVESGKIADIKFQPRG